jgi:hypothetical protein
VNLAALITALTHGDQIVMSHAKLGVAFLDSANNRVTCLGKFDTPGVTHSFTTAVSKNTPATAKTKK